MNDNTYFDVVLVSAGSNKLSVVKRLKEVLNIGLKDAKDFADYAGPNTIIKECVDKDTATHIKNVIEGDGGEIELRNLGKNDIEAIISRYNNLEIKHEDLLKELRELQNKYDELNAEKNAIEEEYNNLNVKCDNVIKKCEEDYKNYNDLLRDFDKLGTEHDDLIEKYNDRAEKYNKLLTLYNKLESEHTALKEKYSKVDSMCRELLLEKLPGTLGKTKPAQQESSSSSSSSSSSRPSRPSNDDEVEVKISFKYKETKYNIWFGTQTKTYSANKTTSMTRGEYKSLLNGSMKSRIAWVEANYSNYEDVSDVVITLL